MVNQRLDDFTECLLALEIHTDEVADHLRK